MRPGCQHGRFSHAHWSCHACVCWVLMLLYFGCLGERHRALAAAPVVGIAYPLVARCLRALDGACRNPKTLTLAPTCSHVNMLACQHTRARAPLASPHTPSCQGARHLSIACDAWLCVGTYFLFVCDCHGCPIWTVVWCARLHTLAACALCDLCCFVFFAAPGTAPWCPTACCAAPTARLLTSSHTPQQLMLARR